jgi:ABC-2 type transport system ATP-binding protein
MEQWKNQQAGTYSTGMKQRVNIARALLTEPDILFLDKPTLGLDPQTAHHIRTFIEALNKNGITVILTTHDMIEAEALSHRIAIIDHGKIATCDTVFNLKKVVKDKENPTLEDVFLNITGFGIRDSLQKNISSPRGHHFGHSNQNRVR